MTPTSNIQVHSFDDAIDTTEGQGKCTKIFSNQMQCINRKFVYS